MKAAVYDRFGGPEVVRVVEVPTPEPKAGEVRIRVQASTVSVADHRMRAKDVPAGLGLLVSAVVGISRPKRAILGMDFVGVIDKLGPGVSRWRVGQEVVGLTGSRFGGHAEFVCLPEGAAMIERPPLLGPIDAVALVFGGHTVAGCLRKVTIRPGHRVLVNGASGAVGTMAVQICQQMGAEVTGVTSARNAELVRSLGAARVIDYAQQDFVADGEIYDVIFDCAGTAPFARARQALKPGGTLLLVIADLKGMLLAGWQSRSGKRVIPISFTPTPVDVALEITMGEKRQIRPVIDRMFSLDEVVEAHRLVDTGHKRGSVVLTIG